MKKFRKDGSRIEISRKSVEPRFLSDPDRRKLLAHFSRLQGFESVRDKAIFEIAWSTGLRCEELFYFDVEDALEENPNGRRTVRSKLPVTGKGEVYREVPVTVDMEAVLTKYLKAKKAAGEPVEMESPVFCAAGGKRLSYRSIQSIVERNCVRSGLIEIVEGGVKSRYSVHDLRHTFAVEYLKAHRSQGPATVYKKLMQIMGHKSISTTMIYTTLELDDEL